MAETLTIDLNKIYSAWAKYVKSNSKATEFSMLGDGTVATFPHANLRMVGNPAASIDLDNDECTWNLTFQTICYIDNPNDKRVLMLYEMDTACRKFFIGLGFRKMGESTPYIRDKVASLTSRFVMPHYNGIIENL